MATPKLIKVARDINLVKTDDQAVGVVGIALIEQMNQENWRRLTIHAADFHSFESAITRYDCDICLSVSSIGNPIYTNADHMGMDVCTQCVNKAWTAKIESLPGWNPGPVYSLTDIVAHAK